MATSRPFAYNPGSPITGTDQVGDLAIGVDPLDYTTSPGGVDWWVGPDEDLGYVICRTDISNSHATPVYLVNASIGFNRSTTKTEGTFVQFVNQEFSQTFSTGDQCKTWLNNNGYWTSWGLSGGGPSIVTSGLTLHLDANTYSGTGTWNDLTANGFTATKQGTVPFTSAGDLSYFTFDSGGNYLLGNAGLNTATTNPVDGTSGVTISTVFQSSNMGRNNNLFSQVNGGGYNFDCGTQPSNLWVNTLRSFAAANSSTDRRGTTPVLSNNVIYLMTMVWDQVNKVATLYVNGSEISSFENTGGAGSLTTGWATNYGASFQLGAMTYYNQYALGNMYKTMVYNRALSSGEVTTNYDAIKNRFGI
jgi:hypothetical protein